MSQKQGDTFRVKKNILERLVGVDVEVVGAVVGVVVVVDVDAAVMEVVVFSGRGEYRSVRCGADVVVS